MMRYEMKREMSEGWEWEDWYGANVHQLRITMMLGIIVSLTLSNYRKPNSYALSPESLASVLFYAQVLIERLLFNILDF